MSTFPLTKSHAGHEPLWCRPLACQQPERLHHIISHIEQPDARPTLGTVQRLAEAMGCAVGDLVRKLT